jgi:NAD(P)-dependent dehydrogenase (short-subunit alcohol dehydrogenase family)
MRRFDSSRRAAVGTGGNGGIGFGAARGLQVRAAVVIAGRDRAKNANVEAKDVGGTYSRARGNKEVLMLKTAVYAAIGFAAISSTALAEDLSSATAPLPPGTFTTSAHSDEWKIANALSAGRRHHEARRRD